MARCSSTCGATASPGRAFIGSYYERQDVWGAYDYLTENRSVAEAGQPGTEIQRARRRTRGRF